MAARQIAHVAGSPCGSIPFSPTRVAVSPFSLVHDATILVLRALQGMTPRETLRQKLRDKRNARTGGATTQQQVAKTAKADPTTALLALGIDDPAMLQLGKAIAADPQQALRALSATKKEPTTDSEDDEAIPPLLE